MVEQTQHGGPPAAPRCQPVADLLKNVAQQIADFEAKKLAEIKTELEAFVKKQETLAKEYAAKYPELRRIWSKQTWPRAQMISSASGSSTSTWISGGVGPPV